MFPVRHKKPRGFTLFELLVLLALLALLFSLFLPAIFKVREAAARSQCGNNLRQVGLASHNCHDQLGKLPPLAGTFPANNGYGPLFFHLLPYVEQNDLYKSSLDATDNGLYVWINNVQRGQVKTFICPQDNSQLPPHLYQDWLATASYAANAQVFAAAANNPQWGDITSLQGAARIPATFQDGTSNTMMYAERYQMCNGEPNSWSYWGDYQWLASFAHRSQGKFQLAPAQKDCNPDLAQTVHLNGILVCLGDASVRSVSGGVSAMTWWYACTPSGGEVLGTDWSN